MSRRPPPPPSGRVHASQSAIVADWGAYVLTLSRKVYGGHEVQEDAAQDIRVHLLKGVEAYWKQHRRPPSDAEIRYMLACAFKNVIRNLRTLKKSQIRPESSFGTLEDAAPFLDTYAVDETTAEDHVLQEEHDRVYRALVHMLGNDITPAKFAMFLDRYGNDVAPRHIARETGTTPVQVTRAVYEAKVSALRFLRSLGITSVDDIAQWSEEHDDD